MGKRADPLRPPTFVGRGKRTWRYATYRGWACRAIQLTAEDDWLGHVKPPADHRLHTADGIGWGTLCTSQDQAETWCKTRIDELEVEKSA